MNKRRGSAWLYCALRFDVSRTAAAVTTCQKDQYHNEVLSNHGWGRIILRGVFRRKRKESEMRNTDPYIESLKNEIDRLRNLNDSKKPDWLSLPWVSEESVDNYDDGQKLLVAIRDIDACGWRYEFIVVQHDFEDIAKFKLLNGSSAVFDWDDIGYVIPLETLCHTFPESE